MKVDINLLPEEHRPNKLALPLTILLVVVILAAGYFGYGFYNRNVDANDELEELQVQLDSINAETEQVISDSKIAEYQEQITQTEAEIAMLQQMERDYETRNSEKIYWKPVIQVIREEAPNNVIIESFDQNDDEITVEGYLSSEAENDIIIMEYWQRLDERGVFSRFDYEFGTGERTIGTGDDAETEEITEFVILLQVIPGGLQ